jgi:ADP-ribose pyrophosphatase
VTLVTQYGVTTIRPWRTLSSTWAFQSPWYNLLLERVETGDGTVVDEYSLGVFPDIVVTVPVTPDRQMILVRQYKHGAREVLVEIPGGYMDEGEDAQTAAVRELREETGYAGTAWETLGHFYPNPTKERGGAITILLLTDAAHVANQEPDPLEQIEVLSLDLAQVYDSPFLSTLRVASTRLGLELARPRLLELGLLSP